MTNAEYDELRLDEEITANRVGQYIVGTVLEKCFPLLTIRMKHNSEKVDVHYTQLHNVMVRRYRFLDTLVKANDPSA